MELSPEEKKRIYEEEKARLEAEKKSAAKKPAAEGGSTTKLPPNKAGFLCYVGFWVTGIIFLIIEKRNRLVRFHAMQSLVVLGILNIIWGVALGVANTFGRAPWGYWGGFYPGYWGYWVVGPIAIAATVVWGVFFAIWWILWAVLMYRTYHGQLYKVPWFGLGNFAEKCLARLDAKK